MFYRCSCLTITPLDVQPPSGALAKLYQRRYVELPKKITQMFITYYYYYYYYLPSGVKILRVKSKVKSKRKAEVVTPRR